MVGNGPGKIGLRPLIITEGNAKRRGEVCIEHDARLVVLHETNASPFVGSGKYMSADGIQNPGDDLVASAELSLDSGFEFVQAPGQSLVAGDHPAQSHEGAHDR